MKRENFIKIMRDRGYHVEFVADGINLRDGFGWRAFVSDKTRLAMNTCSIELPKVDYDLISRYACTPLHNR